MIFFGSQLDGHDIWTIKTMHKNAGTEVHPNLSDIKCSVCNYKHNDPNSEIISGKYNVHSICIQVIWQLQKWNYTMQN
jgi:hypothetical protein